MMYFMWHEICGPAEERGVNGGMKKLVWQWPKREEIFRNGG